MRETKSFEVVRGTTLAAVFGAAMACSSDDGAGGGGGPSNQNAFLQGNCSAIGATTAPSGACFISCETAQCPSGLVCGNSLHQYCRVDFCQKNEDCGAGWYCDGLNCFFPCTTYTDGQSPECPEGYQCASGYGFCLKISGSSNCESGCPSGCCSPSASFCCKPPYCSGNCAGSPCCS